MFSYISALFEDPKGMLLFLLMALPGRLMAISAHECAHAWAAYRCGDSTAKWLGRMTLNPLKHLDIWGTLMMVFLGFGWAKPVPVNRRNFRSLRRDDLKVSLAGVTANGLLMLLGFVVMYAWVLIAVHSSGKLEYVDGILCMSNGPYMMPVQYLVYLTPYTATTVILPLQGETASILFKMLNYFVQTNLALMVFNLLPVPPLDGFHVLTDILPKKIHINTRRMYEIGSAVLLVLMVTGILSEGMGFAMDFVINGICSLITKACVALGLA